MTACYINGDFIKREDDLCVYCYYDPMEPDPDNRGTVEFKIGEWKPRIVIPYQRWEQNINIKVPRTKSGLRKSHVYKVDRLVMRIRDTFELSQELPAEVMYHE